MSGSKPTTGMQWNKWLCKIVLYFNKSNMLKVVLFYHTIIILNTTLSSYSYRLISKHIHPDLSLYKCNINTNILTYLFDWQQYYKYSKIFPLVLTILKQAPVSDPCTIMLTGDPQQSQCKRVSLNLSMMLMLSNY